MKSILFRSSSDGPGFFEKFTTFWKCRINVSSRKWPNCFLLSMNNLIIMYKTYFIQVLLRWT